VNSQVLVRKFVWFANNTTNT